MSVTLEQIHHKLIEISESQTGIEVLQKANHQENKKDINNLWKEQRDIREKLTNLPCNVHATRIEGLKTSIDRTNRILLSIVIMGVLVPLIAIWIKTAFARSSNDKSRRVRAQVQKNRTTIASVKGRKNN